MFVETGFLVSAGFIVVSAFLVAAGFFVACGLMVGFGVGLIVVIGSFDSRVGEVVVLTLGSGSTVAAMDAFGDGVDDAQVEGDGEANSCNASSNAPSTSFFISSYVLSKGSYSEHAKTPKQIIKTINTAINFFIILLNFTFFVSYYNYINVIMRKMSNNVI